MNSVIILTGNPKSTQTIYRSASRGRFVKVYMTKEGKEIKERYIREVLAQYREREPIADCIELEVDLFFGDRRRRDIDNFNKLILDALIGIVYEDDSQIMKLTITKNYDKEYPRAEIIIHKT